MTLIRGLALLQSSYFSLSGIVSRESGNSAAAHSVTCKVPRFTTQHLLPRDCVLGDTLIEAYQRPSGPCSTAEGFEGTFSALWPIYRQTASKPSPSGAAFEVNGCSIVPVKLQNMLHM